MTEDADSPLVLVVDDDPAWEKLIDTWLSDDYRIRTAADGTEALDVYTSDVDLILLDRQMAGPGGYEVLETLRRRDVSCPVVMMTGIEPELDVVDIPFDEYLNKPITESEVREVVDNLLTLTEYDTQLRDLYTVVAKISTLESQYDGDELRDDDRYHSLLERRDRLLERIDGLIHDVEPGTAFRELVPDPDDGRQPDVVPSDPSGEEVEKP